MAIFGDRLWEELEIRLCFLDDALRAFISTYELVDRKDILSNQLARPVYEIDEQFRLKEILDIGIRSYKRCLSLG